MPILAEKTYFESGVLKTLPDFHKKLKYHLIVNKPDSEFYSVLLLGKARTKFNEYIKKISAKKIYSQNHNHLTPLVSQKMVSIDGLFVE
jgi:hypothetical protein